MECWERKDFPKQEYKDFVPIVIFIGMTVRSNHKDLDSPSIGLHLWDNHPTTAISVLGHHSKQASLQKSLHYKHAGYKNKTSWVARWWEKDQEIEGRGTAGGLEKYQESTSLSRPFIYSKSYLSKADKQAPW